MKSWRRITLTCTAVVRGDLHPAHCNVATARCGPTVWTHKICIITLQMLIFSSNSWTVLTVAQSCWWRPLMNLRQSKSPLGRPIHFLTSHQTNQNFKKLLACWNEYFTDFLWTLLQISVSFFGATWDVTAVRTRCWVFACAEAFSSNMICFNRLTDEARKLISELGSKNVHSLAFRDNWLFVGGKGFAVKGDFEKVTATTTNWANSCYSYSQRCPQQSL